MHNLRRLTPAGIEKFYQFLEKNYFNIFFQLKKMTINSHSEFVLLYNKKRVIIFLVCYNRKKNKK